MASSAQAVYSIDLASDETLTSKDIDKRLQIASLTKLMTAYVILSEEKDLNKIMTVPALHPEEGDSVAGLVAGDRLTVLALLNGLLITSGSDAAQTLAVNNAGSQEAFVAKMNAAAATLNLKNTHFANPVGWDDSNNYSSARDITELTRILLRNKTFAEITGTKSKVITTESGRSLPLSTTNQLLYAPGYTGVKTGFTNGAGECLVSLYNGDKGQILTTVIGSSNRFLETDTIKGWILDHFSW
jgi:D-alanyl-D-alanine carboxypeptidase